MLTSGSQTSPTATTDTATAQEAARPTLAPHRLQRTSPAALDKTTVTPLLEVLASPIATPRHLPDSMADRQAMVELLRNSSSSTNSMHSTANSLAAAMEVSQVMEVNLDMEVDPEDLPREDPQAVLDKATERKVRIHPFTSSIFPTTNVQTNSTQLAMAGPPATEPPAPTAAPRTTTTTSTTSEFTLPPEPRAPIF